MSLKFRVTRVCAPLSGGCQGGVKAGGESLLARVALSLSLSLSLTHTHTHTYTLTDTHTHTHTHTQVAAKAESRRMGSLCSLELLSLYTYTWCLSLYTYTACLPMLGVKMIPHCRRRDLNPYRCISYHFCRFHHFCSCE